MQLSNYTARNIVSLQLLKALSKEQYVMLDTSKFETIFLIFNSLNFLINDFFKYNRNNNCKILNEDS